MTPEAMAECNARIGQAQEHVRLAESLCLKSYVSTETLGLIRDLMRSLQSDMHY